MTAAHVVLLFIAVLVPVACYVCYVCLATKPRSVCYVCLATKPRSECPDVLFGAGRAPGWGQVRAVHLRLFPTCAACGTRNDLEVHHVWPVHFPDGGSVELTPENLLTLCGKGGHNCHFYLGHLCDWRARNPAVLKQATEIRQAMHEREYPRKEEASLERLP